MPELRKDPIVGRWVIIATSGRSGRTTSRARPRRRPSRGLCPFCEGQRGQDAARDPRLPRPRHARPTGRAGGSASCPTSSPPCKIEGNLQQARRRHLRQDGRHRRPRGHHREPAPRDQHGQPDRGQHPRGPLGLPRPAGRPEEGHRGWSTACSSRTSAPRPGRQPGAHPRQLIVTPIVPISVWEEMTGVAGVLQLPRPLHLLRHDPAGAGDREADRPRHAALHRLLPLRQPVPVRDLDPAQDTTPATSRTSRRPSVDDLGTRAQDRS